MAADGEDPREESIKVCCRFRPQNQSERALSGKICVEVPDGNSTVRLPNTDHSFVFDRVFHMDSSQEEVYNYAARPIIQAVLCGFNGTVFAYGQTSSGKTYTMEGPDIEDKVHQGVIPRMVWSIFDGIYNADEQIEFLVKVSIVEIYNERIRDLLNPAKQNMKVHEDPQRGVFIGDLTETYVGSEQEIFDAMRAGQYNRSMAVTNMNEHSSRSHLVFMLTIEQKNLHDRSVKVGKLHLVDLAGSEKVAKTGASGERLDEAKNINRSLSALGNVINALTDKKHTHVPYRDSKLTRVLQESLGGNAKTSLIITCSPSLFNEQETLSTCRFGQRAKLITNVVKVNRERSAEELKLLLEKRDQLIAELKVRAAGLEQLLIAKGGAVPRMSSANASVLSGLADGALRSTSELQDELQDKLAEIKDNAETVAKLTAERDEAQCQLASNAEECSRLESSIAEAEQDKLNIERELGDKASELEILKGERQALRQEVEDLQRWNHSFVQSANDGSRSGMLPTATPPVPDPRSPTSASASDARDVEERQKDAERPLKLKVSQLDRNLEQLTVMYHKLVTQNSGLKVEAGESDKKIQRKDQRIAQLERNLREAKQKYEKLLTQCANLTAAMDVMGRSKSSTLSGGSLGRDVVRRANIVRPVRGGVVAARGDDPQEASTLSALSVTTMASPGNISAGVRQSFQPAERVAAEPVIVGRRLPQR
eukprot:TRINITY_DN9540_c0_g1_i1.p1 TRINITY_DN9540_c0_g1~~TRINITY_DN9540_c0_g1_i1.p1  ORF type:complete len:710 (+),score=198.58 TRINITY_DN9540_c0_g1_i1:253-2382(+)